MWIKRKQPLAPRMDPEEKLWSVFGGNIGEGYGYYRLGLCCNECPICLEGCKRNKLSKGGFFYLAAVGFEDMPRQTEDLRTLLLERGICLDLGWTLYKFNLNSLNHSKKESSVGG